MLKKHKSSRYRVITGLRKSYPGKWTYDQCQGKWVHEDGWAVIMCTHVDYFCLSTIYVREDTGEHVFLSPSDPKLGKKDVHKRR